MRSTGSDATGSAYLAALRLLGGRDYTVLRLTARLKEKGFSRDEIEAAVGRLSRERLLDDRRYADRFVESARQSGKYVGFRLRQELRRRGLDTELIESVTGDCNDPQADYALASELVSRKYPAFSGVTSDASEKRRVAGFLQRRGFSSALIGAVIKTQGREDSYE